jgi:aryl-alcohol dehydrogenase-like predicted oxidoreductase
MEKKKVTRRQFIRDGAIVAGGIAAGLGASTVRGAQISGGEAGSGSKILNYNEKMEYRRLGKTDVMVSAIGLGGHSGSDDKERAETVSRCLDAGINYIDSTGSGELQRDLRALGAQRNKVYLGISETGSEPRNPEFRRADKLVEVLDDTLKRAKLDHTDLWRITMYEPGGRHSFDTACEVAEALEKAKKQGKTRFAGISSHDRRWFKFMIEYFPQVEVILFPFTTMSKAAPKDSLFDSLKKCDVGAFGIKPFAAASLFTGDEAEDNRRGRLAIRYILHSNTVIPIPGINRPAEVDNVVRAVTERRELDLKEEAELTSAADETWAQLPRHYEWLKDWEYV